MFNTIAINKVTNAIRLFNDDDKLQYYVLNDMIWRVKAGEGLTLSYKKFILEP